MRLDYMLNNRHLSRSKSEHYWESLYDHLLWGGSESSLWTLVTFPSQLWLWKGQDNLCDSKLVTGGDDSWSDPMAPNNVCGVRSVHSRADYLINNFVLRVCTLIPIPTTHLDCGDDGRHHVADNVQGLGRCKKLVIEAEEVILVASVHHVQGGVECGRLR